MADWHYAQLDASEELAQLHLFSMKKRQPEGDVEFVITVREYVGRNEQSMKFYATADMMVNQELSAFAPFGWGETCWRDFEAVCYGCLLVKPSMAHIDTQPNIFIEKETYVPVRWDLTDLADQCSYYLEHPAEAAAIVDNARRVYRTYFEQNEFVNFIGRLINNSN